MVIKIIELVLNRGFTLTTGDSKQTRLCRLKNGVSQKWILARLLFNIYTLRRPSRFLESFFMQTIQHCDSGNWKDLDRTLSQDLTTLSGYIQIWWLKLSHTKMVTSAFHLNNRETKRELKVYNNNKLFSFCPTPFYLEVKLDRLLTIRHHLVALRKNYVCTSHCLGDL